MTCGWKLSQRSLFLLQEMGGRLRLARLWYNVIRILVLMMGGTSCHAIVFLFIKMFTTMLLFVNYIQPPGHFKVLRLDQDVQDVRGGEVSGEVLPHLQKPLVTYQGHHLSQRNISWDAPGLEDPLKKNPDQWVSIHVTKPAVKAVETLQRISSFQSSFDAG